MSDLLEELQALQAIQGVASANGPMEESELSALQTLVGDNRAPEVSTSQFGSANPFTPSLTADTTVPSRGVRWGDVGSEIMDTGEGMVSSFIHPIDTVKAIATDPKATLRAAVPAAAGLATSMTGVGLPLAGVAAGGASAGLDWLLGEDMSPERAVTRMGLGGAIPKVGGKLGNTIKDRNVHLTPRGKIAIEMMEKTGELTPEELALAKQGKLTPRVAEAVDNIIGTVENVDATGISALVNQVVDPAVLNNKVGPAVMFLEKKGLIPQKNVKEIAASLLGQKDPISQTRTGGRIGQLGTIMDETRVKLDQAARQAGLPAVPGQEILQMADDLDEIGKAKFALSPEEASAYQQKAALLRSNVLGQTSQEVRTSQTISQSSRQTASERQGVSALDSSKTVETKRLGPDTIRQNVEGTSFPSSSSQGKTTTSGTSSRKTITGKDTITNTPQSADLSFGQLFDLRQDLNRRMRETGQFDLSRMEPSQAAAIRAEMSSSKELINRIDSLIDRRVDAVAQSGVAPIKDLEKLYQGAKLIDRNGPNASFGPQALKNWNHEYGAIKNIEVFLEEASNDVMRPFDVHGTQGRMASATANQSPSMGMSLNLTQPGTWVRVGGKADPVQNALNAVRSEQSAAMNLYQNFGEVLHKRNLLDVTKDWGPGSVDPGLLNGGGIASLRNALGGYTDALTGPAAAGGAAARADLDLIDAAFGAELKQMEKELNTVKDVYNPVDVLRFIPHNEVESFALPLFEAARTGDRLRYLQTIGAMASVMPDLRDALGPTKTGMLSEVDGVVTNPMEQIQLKDKATQAMKAGRISSVDLLRLNNALNSNERIVALPSALRPLKRNPLDALVGDVPVTPTPTDPGTIGPSPLPLQ
jgi:hypothetical protein